MTEHVYPPLTPRCYVCGETLGVTFVVFSLTPRTDRIFTVCFRCSERLSDSPYVLTVAASNVYPPLHMGNRKAGAILGSGIDTQTVGVRLSKEEQHCLKLRSSDPPYTFAQINKIVFHGRKTRQAVQLTIRRAIKKQWLLNARVRHMANPSACPVNETPLPGRTVNALKAKGIERLGQLRGVSQSIIAKFEGVGPYGAHLIEKLLTEWGIRNQVGPFCVRCGIPLKSTKRAGRYSCATCKGTFRIEIIAA